jgi:hypothetical protein
MTHDSKQPAATQRAHAAPAPQPAAPAVPEGFREVGKTELAHVEGGWRFPIRRPGRGAWGGGWGGWFYWR